MRARACITWLFVGVSVVAGLHVNAFQTARTITADELFQPTKVWTLHITLPNDRFTALTPTVPPAPPPGTAGAPPPEQVAPSRPMQMPTVLPLEILKQAVAGGFVGPEGGRNGIAAQRGIDFQYVHASLDFDGIQFADVAVRPKGNGTYVPILNGKVQKPSLKIDLNKFVKGQKLGGVSTINLHNGIFDPTWMNEHLALQLYRDAGVPAPRTSYAKVYITSQGGQPRRYVGLYTLVENIDDDFTQSRFKVDSGALLKPVTVLPFTFLSRNWSDYNQMYDPKTDITAAEKERIIEFCEFLATSTDDVFTKRIGEYLDLEAFARYMAVVSWMANPDSLLEQGQNYYVFLHPTTRKFNFIPWDQDHSWGQFIPWRTAESQVQLNVMRPWADRFGNTPFAKQLEYKLLTRTFAHQAFRQLYLKELARLTATITRPERIAAQVDALAPLLRPLVAEEPKDGRTFGFEAAIGTGVFKRPLNPNSPDIRSIKTFVPERQAVVLEQLKTQGAQ